MCHVDDLSHVIRSCQEQGGVCVFNLLEIRSHISTNQQDGYCQKFSKHIGCGQFKFDHAFACSFFIYQKFSVQFHIVNLPFFFINSSVRFNHLLNHFMHLISRFCKRIIHFSLVPAWQWKPCLLKQIFMPCQFWLRQFICCLLWIENNRLKNSGCRS